MLMFEFNATLTAICAGIGALIGTGGVTALLHELSVRHKVKHDSETQKSEKTTELMKYFTEEIKRINEQTKDHLNKIQEENATLKKEISTLNKRITALVRWVMLDNTQYRSWLENTLKTLDPDIDIPKCSDPPIEWESETIAELNDSELS